MRFREFLLEKEDDTIKKALQLDDPNDNEEYLKDMVTGRISLIEYAISLQKKKVLDTTDNIQSGIMADLLKKLRKWKNVLKNRWPKDKDSDDDLSPVPAHPTQPPVDMNTKMPIDLLNKVQGNDKEEEEEKSKK